MKIQSLIDEKMFSFFLGIFIICLSATVALYSVKSQMGGYDLSPLIDLQWRLSKGELPQKDFINTFPYALILLIKSVSWGNLSWFDFTYINIIAAFSTYILISVCGRNERSPHWYVLTAIAISLPLIYTNHLWHSSISQYISMIFLISTYIVIGKKKLHFLECCFIFISASLLITAKQNIAAPIVLATSIYFLLPGQNRKITIIILSGVIFGLVISSAILSQTINDFIYIYSAVLGRSKPDLAMYVAFTRIITHWIALPFMLYISYFFYRSTQTMSSSYRLFLFIFAVISLIPIITDWDSKWNNFSLPIFIAVIASLRAPAHPQTARGRGALLASLIALYFVAGCGGIVRERMKHVGPFYQSPAEVRLSDGYFEDVYVGTNFASILDEVHKVRDRWLGANIYFGPRIEFSYLETQTPSPKHFPLWFHPGTSYPTKDEGHVIEAFKNADFDILIFAKNDRTRLPVEILEFVNLWYTQNPQYNSVDVFIRN
jgi:hypothetical protein